MHLDFRGGGGSSNRNASRNESVETEDESIEAREKHNNHVIISNEHLASMGWEIQLQDEQGNI